MHLLLGLPLDMYTLDWLAGLKVRLLNQFRNSNQHITFTIQISPFCFFDAFVYFFLQWLVSLSIFSQFTGISRFNSSSIDGIFSMRCLVRLIS